MFEKHDGTKIENVEQYVLNWVREHPNVEIHIGSDSQMRNKTTSYVTVICLWNVGKGVHVIFKKEIVPFKPSRRTSGKLVKPDMFSRLWGEIERSKSVADVVARVLLENHLTEQVKFTVHLDINPSQSEGSHIAYDAGVGYIKGCGYDLHTKPWAWAASRAADMLCRV